jgi:hypothetical protein
MTASADPVGSPVGSLLGSLLGVGVSSGVALPSGDGVGVSAGLAHAVASTTTPEAMTSRPRIGRRVSGA